MDIRGLNFTPNGSNPIEGLIQAQTGQMNISIGNMTVHSQAEYDAIVNSMNEGFKYAAGKFGIWIDLLFLGVVVFVAARAIKGVNHKTHWLSDKGMLRAAQVEEIALTYVCMMALYLFALQWVPYFS